MHSSLLIVDSMTLKSRTHRRLTDNPTEKKHEFCFMYTYQTKNKIK